MKNNDSNDLKLFNSLKNKIETNKEELNNIEEQWNNFTEKIGTKFEDLIDANKKILDEAENLINKCKPKKESIWHNLNLFGKKDKKTKSRQMSNR